MAVGFGGFSQAVDHALTWVLTLSQELHSASRSGRHTRTNRGQWGDFEGKSGEQGMTVQLEWVDLILNGLVQTALTSSWAEAQLLMCLQLEPSTGRIVWRDL
jgi:hypothetical protein